MNIEYITRNGNNGRYTGVSYFQQEPGQVMLFNDDDLGFGIEDAFVTYAGPGYTGNIPVENEKTMKAMMADLRHEEKTTDGILIVGSFEHSTGDTSPENDEEEEHTIIQTGIAEYKTRFKYDEENDTIEVDEIEIGEKIDDPDWLCTCGELLGDYVGGLDHAEYINEKENDKEGYSGERD